MIRSFLLSAVLAAVLSVLVPANAQGHPGCTNPDGVAGQCVSIYDCASLKSLLEAKPLTQQAITFLQQSQCQAEGRFPTVCCTDNTGARSNLTTTPPPPVDNIDLSQNPYLPTDCGKDLSQRIYGGNATQLDEFPWMALLEYTSAAQNRRSTLCGGVLISQRYVLTAAHCVSRARIQDWRLVGVRLGEYNIITNPDCVTDDQDQVCADEPISVGIEEQMIHESYRPTALDQRYDIALIRLSRNVRPTTYIKPICLPSSPILGENLHVAGWGRTEHGGSSPIKLKLQIPYSDQDQCKSVYGRRGITLGYAQVCAGGRLGEDTCRGDSGGPLMSFQRSKDGNGRWICVGIVSFGPEPCGAQDWPGVYTRVIDFVPWILSKLRA